MIPVNLAVYVVITLLSILPCVNLCPRCPEIKYCGSSNELQALKDVTYPETADKETVYGGCNFPDPQKQHANCGLEEKGFICDPNGLLLKSELAELNGLILESSNGSYCRCGDACKPSYHGNKIMVAMVKHLRVPDLSEKKCKDESCYEVFPQRNPDASKPPAVSEMDKGVDSILYNLPEQWKHYKCDDFVFILYTALDQKFYMKAGQLPLSESSMESYTDKAHQSMKDTNDLKATLRDLIQTVTSKIKHRYNKFFIIGVSCAVVALLIVIFGVAITYCFCRKERQAGKSYGHIMRSMGNTATI